MKYEKKSKIDDLFPSDHPLPYRTQSRPIHENKKGTMEPAHDRALKNADSPLMLPAFFTKSAHILFHLPEHTD